MSDDQCLDCGETIDKSRGYILMNVCPACLKKAAAVPPRMIEQRGIWIPNPAWAAYKAANP